jgi:hypothetical protein
MLKRFKIPMIATLLDLYCCENWCGAKKQKEPLIDAETPLMSRISEH